jgi:thioredoxin 1
MIRWTAPLFALALAATACSRTEAATPAAAAATAPSHQPAAASQRLLFFMNPYGRPCQLQDEILRQMGPGLQARAQLVTLRTTEQADLAAFQQYGIRGLPSLVVTDASGRELRRATPGIQGAEQVMALLAN